MLLSVTYNGSGKKQNRVQNTPGDCRADYQGLQLDTSRLFCEMDTHKVGPSAVLPLNKKYLLTFLNSENLFRHTVVQAYY